MKKDRGDGRWKIPLGFSETGPLVMAWLSEELKGHRVKVLLGGLEGKTSLLSL